MNPFPSYICKPCPWKKEISSRVYIVPEPIIVFSFKGLIPDMQAAEVFIRKDILIIVKDHVHEHHIKELLYYLFCEPFGVYLFHIGPEQIIITLEFLVPFELWMLTIGYILKTICGPFDVSVWSLTTFYFHRLFSFS